MRAVLSLNAGSSSLRAAAFDEGGAARCRAHAQLGHRSRLKVTLGGVSEELPLPDGGSHEAALEAMLRWLRGPGGIDELTAIGHRFAHGGLTRREPVVLDSQTLHELSQLVPLAPLHLPANLAGVRAAAESCPGVVQVACFDTAFHATIPWLNRQYALPRALSESGLVAYGFHGLSYEYIASRLPAVLGDRAAGRVVVAHLGSGASVCALHELESVATTMGFSPLDGLVMGTRCGAIDPGVILYLLTERGMSPAQVQILLYQQSGLLGVSGVSGDMRALLQSDKANAREAVDLFVTRAARGIAEMAAALKGIDALVFTGGIGAHSDLVRRLIVEEAAWLGLQVDAAANAHDQLFISPENAPRPVLVIETDEESMVASATRRLTAAQKPPPTAVRDAGWRASC